jgi:gamma-glutamyltranspeptidase
MARSARGAGGLFAGADFTNQSASWGTPLTGTYRDVTVFNYAAADPGFQRH